jgi:hypothetical protein
MPAEALQERNVVFGEHSRPTGKNAATDFARAGGIDVLFEHSGGQMRQVRQLGLNFLHRNSPESVATITRPASSAADRTPGWD